MNWVCVAVYTVSLCVCVCVATLGTLPFHIIVVLSRAPVRQIFDMLPCQKFHAILHFKSQSGFRLAVTPVNCLMYLWIKFLYKKCWGIYKLARKAFVCDKISN